MTLTQETTGRETGTPAIRQLTEIALHVPNDLRVLGKLFATLAAHQRSIVAWCCCSKHERTTVLLVTRNQRQTERALGAAGFECESKPALVVGETSHSPSMAQLSAELRAAGIEVLDTYTGCSPRNGTLSVVRTSDNPHAAEVLEAMNRDKDNPSVLPAT